MKTHIFTHISPLPRPHLNQFTVHPLLSFLSAYHTQTTINHKMSSNHHKAMEHIKISLPLFFLFLLLAATSAARYIAEGGDAAGVEGKEPPDMSSSFSPAPPSAGVGRGTPSGDSRSGHGPDWDYNWGWGSSPQGSWGFGSGSGQSPTGSGRGFGYGYGSGREGSGSGYGYGSGGDSRGEGHGTGGPGGTGKGGGSGHSGGSMPSVSEDRKNHG